MSALESPELWTAIAALVTAVGGLVAVIRHVNGPSHQPPGGDGG